ncbi:MAG: hypothetical protein U9P37_02285, partial [Pseudomonadota bacterium]|nr:hypothetical protein [Pseudomonadota bacterium]
GGKTRNGVRSCNHTNRLTVYGIRFKVQGKTRIKVKGKRIKSKVRAKAAANAGKPASKNNSIFGRLWKKFSYFTIENLDTEGKERIKDS